MDSNNLMSILILSYNDLKYFKDCLATILSQDYPYIEIILSDDCSKDFNEEEIKDYIENNKRENIVNYVINRNTTHLGLVKNINKAIQLSNGEYLMHVYCCDGLYSDQIISKVVRFYKTSDFLTAVGFIAYMDKELKVWNGFHTPIEQNVQYIKGEAKTCFDSLCSVGPFFPTQGLSYRRELINKYGLYDEEYVVNEGLSRFLYLTRNGCRIGFINDYLIKYRGLETKDLYENKDKIKEIVAKDFILANKKEKLVYQYLAARFSNLRVNNLKSMVIRESDKFNQHTLINGKGKVMVGERCCFGNSESSNDKGCQILLQGRYEDSIVQIGDDTKIGDDVTIIAGKKVIIGKNCSIENGVFICDFDINNSPKDKNAIKEECDEIIIGDGVTIGAESTILKGVTIGDNCSVSPSSVVMEKIEANSKVFGNPAKAL